MKLKKEIFYEYIYCFLVIEEKTKQQLQIILQSSKYRKLKTDLQGKAHISCVSGKCENSV